MSVLKSLAHAWNAFVNMDGERLRTADYGVAYGGRPDRVRMTTSNERSIITSILVRMAIDVATSEIRHVRLDGEGRYLADIDSGLNNCLTVEANIDQGAMAFLQDAAMTLLDRGSIAIVPVDTDVKPSADGGFNILTMRIGEIVQWMPRHVKVSLYNEMFGRREEITLEKKAVAIIENPLFAVMNETSSTLQRIIRKLNLLDAVDEQSSSGKLDMIIQLPYVIKTESKRREAEARRKEIEVQLKGSQYGIAYTDGTEKITQLNRPAENQLLGQIQYLMTMLYGQLGITEAVMNGTADEATMINYHNRAIEPILKAITQGMHRSFLTKTARTQKQAVQYFRDPFKLVPISAIGDLADKLTRNEILSSNEFRQIVGRKPRQDPKADELRNSNMPQSELGAPSPSDPIKVPSTRATPARAIE